MSVSLRWKHHFQENFCQDSSINHHSWSGTPSVVETILWKRPVFHWWLSCTHALPGEATACVLGRGHAHRSLHSTACYTGGILGQYHRKEHSGTRVSATPWSILRCSSFPTITCGPGVQKSTWKDKLRAWYYDEHNLDWWTTCTVSGNNTLKGSLI